MKKCLECGKEYERDESHPKWKIARQQMGAMIDQCDECLKKWIMEEKKNE